MSKRTLTPLRGYALIRLESHFTNTGPIIIPDKYKVKKGYIGHIEAITHKDNKPHDLTVGLRVCVVAIGGDKVDNQGLTRFPIKHILAIIPEDMKANIPDAATPRCKYCGQAKSSGQNVMLTPGPRGKMYCPRCKRDQYGEKVDPFEKPPMSDELEQVLSSPGIDETRPVGVSHPSGKITVVRP